MSLPRVASMPPAASTASRQSERLAELDRRHEELISQLEDLNSRIEATLDGIARREPTSAAPASPTC
ncbi:MAG: hypothetical protein KDA37_16215 [Planctomycetales bacterium]|nr:hypothetical protein [Planctomycetales bacterium]